MCGYVLCAESSLTGIPVAAKHVLYWQNVLKMVKYNALATGADGMAEQLYVIDREDWRKWLKKNYDVKKEVWLIYYRKCSGRPSISYDESVEEALCFGWVDSIIKKIDDEKFGRKFSPRTGKSGWSESNKKRAESMIKEAKMTEAGLAKIREAKGLANGSKLLSLCSTERN